MTTVEKGEPAKPGLRQRKKQQTRARIQQTALGLFLEKGYERTTTSEIARAADVSAGTLFNYFPTKESLLADEFDRVFVQQLVSRPPTEPIFTAVRRAMRGGLAEAPEMLSLSLARGRLILATPALRAAKHLEDDRDAGRLAVLLAERFGQRADDFEVAVMSRLIVGAVAVAFERWVGGDGRDDVIALVDRALGIAEAAGAIAAALAGESISRQ